MRVQETEYQKYLSIMENQNFLKMPIELSIIDTIPFLSINPHNEEPEIHTDVGRSWVYQVGSQQWTEIDNSK